MVFVRKSKFRRAFTLLELMIAVAVIGIALSTAVPLYDRLMMEVKIAEATRALYHAHKLMESFRIRNPSAEYTDLIASSRSPSLNMSGEYTHPKFNLITGAPGMGSGESSGYGGTSGFDAYALSQLPGMEYLMPIDGRYSLNDFGFARSTTYGDGGSPDGGSGGPSIDRTKVLIGVELDPDEDGYHHVLAINEAGRFFEICNDAVDALSSGANTFLDHTGRGANCEASAGGESGGGDGGEGGGAAFD